MFWKSQLSSQPYVARIYFYLLKLKTLDLINWILIWKILCANTHTQTRRNEIQFRRIFEGIIYGINGVRDARVKSAQRFIFHLLYKFSFVVARVASVFDK